jgi:hypothetical protein
LKEYREILPSFSDKLKSYVDKEEKLLFEQVKRGEGDQNRLERISCDIKSYYRTDFQKGMKKFYQNLKKKLGIQERWVPMSELSELVPLTSKKLTPYCKVIKDYTPHSNLMFYMKLQCNCRSSLEGG